MQPADSVPRHPRTATRVAARAVLTIYGITLAMIALWPVPVDSGSGGLLRVVTRIFPVLTYSRIEFSANILLFVPLGVLLMLILRRRYLILPIAIVVTLAIECSQALLLDRRTPSMLDIIANTAGACIGMLIVAVVESMHDRPARGAVASAGQPQNDAEKWAALGFVAPPSPPLPAAPAAPAAPAPPAARAGESLALPDWAPPVPPPPSGL